MDEYNSITAFKCLNVLVFLDVKQTHLKKKKRKKLIQPYIHNFFFSRQTYLPWNLPYDSLAIKSIYLKYN